MSNNSNSRKTLRRTYGARELVNANGHAIATAKAPHRLIFANVANVRPFNFRNAAVEASHANGNTKVPLVNGRNARGKAPIIPVGDPRKQSVFAEAMGTNLETLGTTMAANKASRAAGIQKFIERRTTPNNLLHLPVMNVFRVSQPPINRRGLKERRLMAAQYNLGHSVPELNQLAMEGANDEYIAEEAELLAANYQNQADHNAAVAQRAAKINADVAEEIEREIAAAANGSKSRRSRRNRRARKTRRNRK